MAFPFPAHPRWREAWKSINAWKPLAVCVLRVRYPGEDFAESGQPLRQICASSCGHGRLSHCLKYQQRPAAVPLGLQAQLCGTENLMLPVTAIRMYFSGLVVWTILKLRSAISDLCMFFSAHYPSGSMGSSTQEDHFPSQPSLSVTVTRRVKPLLRVPLASLVLLDGRLQL